ncbi:hypothetical protein [Streptomyces mirabilis]|uniref:hypothetical protein n=1 Tax=Streptomyces mirabilis TaxID=68239 RepID=UPI0036AC61C5
MKHSSLRGSAIAVGLTMGLAVTAVPSIAYAQTTIACGDIAGLITAINTLNSGNGGTIELAKGCTYTFTAPIAGTNDALPPILKKITITGHDSALVRQASGAPLFRLLEVAATGDLTLHGVEISGGHIGVTITEEGDGGGIKNHGKLTLDESEVTGNAADNEGGGIYNDEGATLTANRSSISGNTSVQGGAGLSNNETGTVTLKHTTVVGNQSGDDAGGITNAGNATLTVEDSTVSHNTSREGDGGGIINGGRAKLRETVVSDNFAAFEGGGINNSDEATLEITGGQITENNAGRDGGGINNEGAATLTKVKVKENSTGRHGGGINNEFNTETGLGATLTLHHSTVTENTAARNGGGINKQAGTSVTLDDSSVVKNKPNNCFPLGSVTGCQN